MSRTPTDDEPEGVRCPCGEFTPFNVWVYAHWRERIRFVCPKCERVFDVYAGVAKPDKQLKRSKS